MKYRCSKEKFEFLRSKANWLRKKILHIAVSCGGGHVAPSFSCIDILVAFYYTGFLRFDPKKPKWENRDRFIFSKGHVAIAAYTILADLGFFPLKELETFSIGCSYLGGHLEAKVPGVENCSGSLGHGLSIGAGIALANKLDKKKNKVVVLMGDGECQEGSVWEAALFASNHKLKNLITVIDHNGFCAMEKLENHLNIEPLDKKFKAFGWDTVKVNGHSFKALETLLIKLNTRKSSKPLAIIASTTKGKGVSFMENNPIWHYRIPKGRELELAYKELSG